MIVHFNGRCLPDHDVHISIWDGGFLYGDGVYTTLRLYAGRPLDLTAHHARLLSHARALQIPLDLELQTLRRAVADLVSANDMGAVDGRLRLTVSRGGHADNPLPLTGLADLAPNILMTLVPVGDHLATWQKNGIAVLCLAEGNARGNFPTLKTLNGLATITALRRAAAAGCQEALLTGPGDLLLEGAVSNIFLVRDGALATPAAQGSFLPGRTRERILGLAPDLGLTTRVAALPRATLNEAEEVFVVSSVREVLPVVRIDGRPVGHGRPGPVTRLVQKAYGKLIADALTPDTDA